MDSKYTFKHLEATDAIKNYASSRVEKIEKFSLHKLPKCHFIFSVQKNEHIAEINFDSGGAHFNALATDGNLYTAIDKVVDKLANQLSRYKEKLQDHHHTPTTVASAELSGEEEVAQRLAKRK